MFIEMSQKESRVFNLDDPDDNQAWNDLLTDPSVKVLDKKWINHTEVEQSGRDRTETKENHLYVEWERCSL